jgi:membrane dipeptidase
MKPHLRSAFLILSTVLSTHAASPAEDLVKKMIILDSHIDYPMESKGDGDPSKRTKGDFDFPRARKGGLKVAFMAIYISPEEDENGLAQQTADRLITFVESCVQRFPDQAALARTPAEVRKNAAEGKISLPMGMENGAPIAGDLANISAYYDRGIRYITLTHAKNNHICDASMDDAPKWNGLSPFGKRVVAEMNRVGMMIDVSHVSDDTIRQVAELTKAPIIASHSTCRALLVPGTLSARRNMPDDLIQLVAGTGGVVQIQFGRFSLRSPEVQRPQLKDVVAHIDHVVKLVGPDHVGLGSDFDGVEGSLPDELKDVSMYPNLVRELMKSGYSNEDIEKICGGNLLRVWSEVEAVAKSLHEAN